MRTREAAHPDAHAPARPRSRVVRARTWVRAPPMVLPDAVREGRETKRALPALRQSAPEFFRNFFFPALTVGHGHGLGR